MSVATLNEKVARAILEADCWPSGSLEEQSAFREISILEEAIAALTEPAEIDGELGRLGAVASALSSKDPLRALQLLRRYSEHGMTETAIAQLATFAAEAEADIDSLALDAPMVEAIRFQLLEL